MLEELSSFLLGWERYHEKISYCTMPHVCKKKSKRDKYMEIYEEIKGISIIRHYQFLTKQYISKFKINPDTGKFENINYYVSVESIEKIKEAKKDLEEIQKKCKK